jgi:Spy/CpxP family protein refolding chaperone
MGGMRGMFGGFRRNRDNGGDTNNQSTDNTNRSPVEIAQRELQQVLDNKDSTPDQIAAKLKALREARDKAHQDLVSAQKDLKEVLTPRQEAVLVNISMLD